MQVGVLDARDLATLVHVEVEIETDVLGEVAAGQELDPVGSLEVREIPVVGVGVGGVGVEADGQRQSAVEGEQVVAGVEELARRLLPLEPEGVPGELLPEGLEARDRGVAGRAGHPVLAREGRDRACLAGHENRQPDGEERRESDAAGRPGRESMHVNPPVKKREPDRPPPRTADGPS